jgi:hypothetical protein
LLLDAVERARLRARLLRAPAVEVRPRAFEDLVDLDVVVPDEFEDLPDDFEDLPDDFEDLFRVVLVLVWAIRISSSRVLAGDPLPTVGDV